MVSFFHVDLNSFFASVEQQLHPELRGRPVGVVPMVAETTCCIAASYEAKRLGVKTGTSVREARQLCPEIVLVTGRPSEYVRIHHLILEAADTVLPVHAVHSIDEFSCRLMGAERERDRALELGRRMKHAIVERVGVCLTSSVGIAPNRWLAKIASDMMKPDGLVIIEPHELPSRLFGLELQDLPGIGPRMDANLRAKGVTSVEQLCGFERHELRALWGSVWGEYMWRWLRGEDVEEPATHRSSIGHEHVLPPAQRNEAGARAVAAKLLAKAATRARHMGYRAGRLVLSLRFEERHPPTRAGSGEPPPGRSGFRWDDGDEAEELNAGAAEDARARGGHSSVGSGAPKRGPRRSWHGEARFPETADTLTLMQALLKLWGERPKGTPFKVGVTLVDVIPDGSATGALFEGARRRGRLAQAMDRINAHLGRNSVYFGAMHGAEHAAPMRIAFSHIPDRTMAEVAAEMSNEMLAPFHPPGGKNRETPVRNRQSEEGVENRNRE